MSGPSSVQPPAPVDTPAAPTTSDAETTNAPTQPVDHPTPIDVDQDADADGDADAEGIDDNDDDSISSFHNDDLESDSDAEPPVPAARRIVRLKDIKTLREAYEDKSILSLEDQNEARAAAKATGSGVAATAASVAKAFFGAATAKKEKEPEVEREYVPKYSPDPKLLERVSLFQGDITKMKVDCIVNAANRSLLGGGGVDGAIHHAAGPKLLAECRTLGGCETGNSKITRAYELPSNYIIHTVGPIYSSHEVEQKAAQLASCYTTSLEVAVDNSIKEIAFPSISTGIYGYPIEDATHVALKVARTFLETNSTLDRIIFVVWSDKDRDVYRELIPEYFPPGEKPTEIPAETKEETSAAAEEPAAPSL